MKDDVKKCTPVGHHHAPPLLPLVASTCHSPCHSPCHHLTNSDLPAPLTLAEFTCGGSRLGDPLGRYHEIVSPHSCRPQRLCHAALEPRASPLAGMAQACDRTFYQVGDAREEGRARLSEAYTFYFIAAGIIALGSLSGICNI